MCCCCYRRRRRLLDAAATTCASLLPWRRRRRWQECADSANSASALLRATSQRSSQRRRRRACYRLFIYNVLACDIEKRRRGTFPTRLSQQQQPKQPIVTAPRSAAQLLRNAATTTTTTKKHQRVLIQESAARFRSARFASDASLVDFVAVCFHFRNRTERNGAKKTRIDTAVAANRIPAAPFHLLLPWQRVARRQFGAPFLSHSSPIQFPNSDLPSKIRLAVSPD